MERVIRQPSFKNNVNTEDQPQDDDSSDGDVSRYSSFPNEKAMLQALRWAKHISTGVEISNDHLTQKFPGTPRHQLTRMVIAMGWPPEKPDGENPQPVIEEANGPAHGALVHRDLFNDDSGVGNIMVGDLLPEDPGLEHMCKQYLKYGDDETANRRAICRNLREMSCLRTLLLFYIFPPTS
ncbi:hypothetical protein CHU98_g4415 [Xylaria longipes]|nr:hypothetical protein CHU98_g4415 [Xylaria longipes]